VKCSEHGSRKIAQNRCLSGDWGIAVLLHLLHLANLNLPGSGFGGLLGRSPVTVSINLKLVMPESPTFIERHSFPPRTRLARKVEQCCSERRLSGHPDCRERFFRASHKLGRLRRSSRVARLSDFCEGTQRLLPESVTQWPGPWPPGLCFVRLSSSPLSSLCFRHEHAQRRGGAATDGPGLCF